MIWGFTYEATNNPIINCRIETAETRPIQQRYSDCNNMLLDTLMNDPLRNSRSPCYGDEAVQNRYRTVDTQWEP